MSGRLVLVATPIGNLGDLTRRAIETLRDADVIACEDTRRTATLLNHVDVRGVPLIAVHEHNEVESATKIVERVAEGQVVALVTDAGMPAISDPGAKVVRAVADADLSVSVVPGPSAVPAAVAVSGFPSARFCFEGFLPRKGSERARRLTEVASARLTTVIYEAPHRLLATATNLATSCGAERDVVLVRELTKLHEEIWRGSLGGLVDHLESRSPKGECVVVISPAPEPAEASETEIVEALKDELAGGATRKDAVARVVERTGAPRNRVYALAAVAGHAAD